jgi:DNA-directed RNA polymerase subunit RPC12/RpoP
MSDTSGEIDVPAAEDAFAVLADDIRLAVMRELYAADGPLSFSELRRRVGVDDSGGFNYHLGKLTDHFVERGADGYELRTGAERILGAVFAGSYGGLDGGIDPIPVDGDCPTCDGPISAVYEDGLSRVVCDDCGMQVFSYPIPPAIIHDRDRATLPGVFSRYARTVLDQIVGGICPVCFGPTEPDLETLDGDGEAGIEYRCRRCGQDFSLTVGVTLLDHPAVRSFAADHDCDVPNAPLWELDFVFSASERRTDNGVEAVIAIGDETLTITLDEDLTVVETKRG